MGKQVRFYMLPEDEQTFLQFVSQDPAVVFLRPVFPEPRLRFIEKPLDSNEKTILLWHTAFPIDEKCIRQLVLRRYNEEYGAYVETGEVKFALQSSDAPVIEFSRSFMRHEDWLAKGRLWAEMYRLEGDKFVYKGQEFESWYDQLARWIRHNFKHIKGTDGYLGRKAFEWYQKGGRLSK